MSLYTICDTVWCFWQFQLEILLSRLQPSPLPRNVTTLCYSAMTLLIWLQCYNTELHCNLQWATFQFNDTDSVTTPCYRTMILTSSHRHNVTVGNVTVYNVTAVVPKMVISASSASTSLNWGFVFRGKSILLCSFLIFHLIPSCFAPFSWRQ